MSLNGKLLQREAAMKVSASVTDCVPLSSTGISLCHGEEGRRTVPFALLINPTRLLFLFTFLISKAMHKIFIILLVVKLDYAYLINLPLLISISKSH